jgi:hypothetical protein
LRNAPFSFRNSSFRRLVTPSLSFQVSLSSRFFVNGGIAVALISGSLYEAVEAEAQRIVTMRLQRRVAADGA